MKNKPVHVPKRIIGALVTDSPIRIIATEAALLKTDPEVIRAAHYKRSVGGDTQMTHEKDVEARDDQNLKLDWWSEVQLSDDYGEIRDQSHAHCV